jgi:hypothetical protein
MMVARWRAILAWMLWDEKSKEDLCNQLMALVLSSKDRIHGNVDS